MSNGESYSARSPKLIRRLALYLMQVKEGERLPNVRELAEMYHVSVGSISNALAQLESMGVVSISKHGHVGSFVQSRSLGRLWEIARREPIVVAHTLPTNALYEGLATGIKKLISSLGVEVYLIFIRGSEARLQALRQKRCHLALVSGFAARELCKEGEEILLTLPPGSWLPSHRVYYRPLPSGEARRPRVAIDMHSFDHRRLTELEFADQDVEFKPVSFMQIHRLLADGFIDATVWPVDEVLEAQLGERIRHRPLSDHVLDIVGTSDRTTALVGRSEDFAIRAIVEATLSADALVEYQRKVAAGELVPEY